MKRAIADSSETTNWLNPSCFPNRSPFEDAQALQANEPPDRVVNRYQTRGLFRHTHRSFLKTLPFLGQPNIGP
jgi:hypothetical protein